MKLLAIAALLVALFLMQFVLDCIYENVYFNQLPKAKQEQIIEWLKTNEL